MTSGFTNYMMLFQIGDGPACIVFSLLPKRGIDICYPMQSDPVKMVTMVLFCPVPLSTKPLKIFFYQQEITRLPCKDLHGILSRPFPFLHAVLGEGTNPYESSNNMILNCLQYVLLHHYGTSCSVLSLT